MVREICGIRDGDNCFCNNDSLYNERTNNIKDHPVPWALCSNNFNSNYMEVTWTEKL